MANLTSGAQAAIAQIVAEGANVILGIPGVHTLSLCDAVLDHPELRFIHGRHEQGITFMANGYARASGRIAVSLPAGVRARIDTPSAGSVEVAGDHDCVVTARSGSGRVDVSTR